MLFCQVYRLIVGEVRTTDVLFNDPKAPAIKSQEG